MREDGVGEERVGGEDQERTPWSFWVLVGSAALYLGIRLIQGIAWVVDRI